MPATYWSSLTLHMELILPTLTVMRPNTMRPFVLMILTQTCSVMMNCVSYLRTFPKVSDLQLFRILATPALLRECELTNIVAIANLTPACWERQNYRRRSFEPHGGRSIRSQL